jgi:hypothetical protein
MSVASLEATFEFLEQGCAAVYPSLSELVRHAGSQVPVGCCSPQGSIYAEPPDRVGEELDAVMGLNCFVLNTRLRIRWPRSPLPLHRIGRAKVNRVAIMATSKYGWNVGYNLRPCIRHIIIKRFTETRAILAKRAQKFEKLWQRYASHW